MNLFTPMFVLALSIFFGWATQKIIKDKGYDENWFWWGFFFGVIALTVALLQTPIPREYIRPTPVWHRKADDTDTSLMDFSDSDDNSQTGVKFAGWNCPCGRQNASYTGTCACGRTREIAAEQLRKRNEAAAKTSEKVKASVSNRTAFASAEAETLTDKRTELVRELETVKNILAKAQVSSASAPKPNPSVPIWVQSAEPIVNETAGTSQTFDPSPTVPPSFTPTPTYQVPSEIYSAPAATPVAAPAATPATPAVQRKPAPAETPAALPEPESLPRFSKEEIKKLLDQASLLETAREIYVFLEDNRDRVKTQEYDSLLLELRNCSDVERVYGNSKSTAILHINLYRNTISFQTEYDSFL